LMETASTNSEPRIKRTWTVIAAWMSGITAVVAFLGTVTGSFKTVTDHFHYRSSIDAKIAVAKQQQSQGEYSAALQTYAAILQSAPSDKPAQQAQLAATEEWLRNFNASVSDDKDPKTVAAGYLDQIFPVLDTALTHAQGPASADIKAHLGWAHWMNRYIAMREFGPTAEQDMRDALAADPNNVYAHAMLGNWLLVNHHDLAEALQHFGAAEATGKDRSFVRRYELGALIHDEEPGARAAVMRIAHSMQQSNEPLDAGRKLDALSFCCNPSSTFRKDRVESFSALPPTDAMQTYVWLDEDAHGNPQAQALKRQFIQAFLSELSGDRSGALRQLQKLRPLVQTAWGTTLDEQIDEEIEVLSK
jgi:tetratricopeptide (TPR) repeat protein